MRIFGHRISISVKIKNREKETRFAVDSNVQRKVLGSYSQYLEDIFIESIFRNKETGSYIDIGANDPAVLSNTKRFYDRGWSGVNVEPDVALYKKICAARPLDVNLNVGIGKQADNLTFYELSPNTLSTFNKKAALHSVKREGARIISETLVKVISLADLFSSTMVGRQVDFLSLDAEGYEREILSSNDWDRHRPTAIIVELNQDKQGTVLQFLKNQGYVLIYYNGTNGILVDGRARDVEPFLRES
jgi:FkbM family methyltransferase